MKILQINKLYLPTIGGIETIVRDIAEGLNDKTDMTVLVCNSKGEAVDEQYNGVHVIRAKSYGMAMSLPVSFDFFWKFFKIRNEADIIQIHEPFPLADLALWLFGCKAKVVVWWHSDIIRQKLMLKLLHPFIRHTLKRAERIIVATEGHIKSSVFLPEFISKCRIIPYGLNFDEYPVPEINDYLTEKLTDKANIKLLFVGRLVYYKGVRVLIDAMKYVKDAELFIVGDGALCNDLQKAVEINLQCDKIHFIGHIPRDEMLAAFSDCDVFILPSIANSEAFGIVQLEAMYYGKPVINTNLPTGVPHVSIDGETGITVEAGNVNSLADAINTLVNDTELRKKYGQNGFQRVCETFDVQKMLCDLHDEYERIIGI